MTVSQYVENGDSGGALLMRNGEDWVLVGTSFYSYVASAELAAQRVSYYLSWTGQYVEVTPEPAPPAVPPSSTPGTSPGVTITLRNQTPSLRRVDDLLTTAGASRAAAGGSVDVQIQGQDFRTVLLVECGQP